MWERRPVLTDEVGPAGKIYKTVRESAFGVIEGGWGGKGGTEIRASRHQANSPKINNKLEDLETSNPFLPPNANAPCALEVIPIHNNMYH